MKDNATSSASPKKSNEIPLDDGILIIDKLLSSGWTSILDMSIALDEYARENGYEDNNVFGGTSLIEYYNWLMEAGGLFSGRIRSSYFYHMSEIWTRVHLNSPDPKKKDLFIDAVQIKRSNCERYNLSDATKLYLLKGRGVKILTVFRYKIEGYSIQKDMSYCSEVNKSLLDKKSYENSNIQYDKGILQRMEITPDSDVLVREIKSLKIKELQDALLRDTIGAIKWRISEIERIKDLKPHGWIMQIANHYLNALYDAKGIVGEDVIEPIVNQYISHILDHFPKLFFPVKSISIIKNYKQDFPNLDINENFDENITKLVSILNQEEFSSEDLDLIGLGYGWNVAAELGNLDDTQYKAVEKLDRAVWELMDATRYVYDLFGTTAIFSLYEIDNSIDLNLIIGQIHALIECYYNHYEALDTNCNNAESVFVKKCNNFIDSLNKNVDQNRFIIGIIKMALAIVQHDASIYFGDKLSKSDISIGLNAMGTEEIGYFNNLYQTLCFDNIYGRFMSSAAHNALSKTTQDLFIKMCCCLCVNLLEENIELADGSYHHTLLVNALEQYEIKVSEAASIPLENQEFRIVLKYAVILFKNKPFPMSIADGCTPAICETSLNDIIDNAVRSNLNENQLQVLLFILSIIALRHLDYDVEYIAEEKSDPINGDNLSNTKSEDGNEIPEEILPKEEFKKKAYSFIPVSEKIVSRMIPGKYKSVMEKKLMALRTGQNYYGFIHL